MINISEQSKQNLQKLLEFVGNLGGATGVNLNMEHYYDTSGNCKNYHCNTNLCLAGMIPLVDKEFADKYIRRAPLRSDYYCFSTMSQRFVSGINFAATDTWEEVLWNFIFSNRWTNDINHTIKRIQFVIHNGRHPNNWDKKYNWQGQ